MSEPPFRSRRKLAAPLLYRLSMYSGLRALWNRAWAIRSGRVLGAEILQGVQMELPDLGTVRLSVHGRVQPKGEPQSKRFAMVSARQVRPTMNRAAYAYWLATTHFGCGHLELGVFEQAGRWTFVGVRNMSLANANRLGFGGANLGSHENSVSDFARACRGLLKANGIQAEWAPPAECARLSIRQELIPPDQRRRVQRHITARYQRLYKTFDSPTRP